MLSPYEAWDTGVKASVPVPSLVASLPPDITRAQVTIAYTISQALIPAGAGSRPVAAPVSTSPVPLVGHALILALFLLVANKGQSADSGIHGSALVTRGAVVQVGAGVEPLARKGESSPTHKASTVSTVAAWQRDRGLLSCYTGTHGACLSCRSCAPTMPP